MAANVINQISSANTFQQWLIATTSLIGTTNLLTNGNGDSFFANTTLVVGGSGPNVSLNVETSATINDLVGNTANIIDLTARNLVITSNVDTLRVTNDAFVGDDLTVYGNANITGNLIVSGNVVLDEIGFNDLHVAGSADIANNLTVTGNTDLNGITNIQSANVNSLVGNANTNIYAAIAAADASALAYAIALG
jgi:hypothetical protein